MLPSALSGLRNPTGVAASSRGKEVGSVPTKPARAAPEAREDDAAIEAVTHLTYDAQVAEVGRNLER